MATRLAFRSFKHKNAKSLIICVSAKCSIHAVASLELKQGMGAACTVFVPIPAHVPITAHQRHFQFKICGTINRPLKSNHPVTSDYVPSPVLNTENHQLTLC